MQLGQETVVAGEPPTVKLPAVTPVTEPLKVTETLGRLATAVRRVGTSLCTVAAFVNTVFCAPGEP
jgi:hypothetical protein